MSAVRFRRGAAACATAGAVLLAGGCSIFDDGTSTTSVFELSPGDCVRAPEDYTVELTSLTTVACEEPHELEVFALVEYTGAAGADDSDAAATFPGDPLLKDFADGACAELFAAYVGIDYRDSSLFFTYLVPSVRSWENDGDREVTCLITTTGEQLTASVAGAQI